MLSEEQASQLSPTSAAKKNRPVSGFSVVSEAATFYSALDLPASRCTSNDSIHIPDHGKVNSHTGVKELGKNKRCRESAPPDLSRQDSGYAAYTNSTLSSSTLTSPNRRPKAKRSAKSDSLRNTRRSPRNRSSPPQLRPSQSYTEHYQTKSKSRRSSSHIYRPQHILNQKYFSELSFFAPNYFNANKSSSVENFTPPQSPPPIPSTINYWTSDSSRRLEYAAIDAASKGVRGFLVRMVPDCILPVQIRRTRFWEQNDDKRQREGSVRRYRLPLPDEPEIKRSTRCEQKNCGSWRKDGDTRRTGLLRRLSIGLKLGRS